MKFAKNAFIKWIDEDEDGTFSHTGQVISHKNGVITFIDKNGNEMGVPEDDGEFKVVRKPRNWNTTEVISTKASAAVKKPKTTRTKKPGGKLAQVIALLKADKPASRKDAIAQIVAAGITTAAGASTYYNKAKSQL